MRLKAFLAYALAGLMIVVALGTFMGRGFLAAKFVAVTGIKVSPWYTGGEVLRVVDHGRYRTVIHRPVFDALIGEKSEGFVQIDWEPRDSLPATIAEDIAIRGDGDKDFRLILDTATGAAELIPCRPRVLALQGSYKLKERWSVRVVLRRSEIGLSPTDKP